MLVVISQMSLTCESLSFISHVSKHDVLLQKQVNLAGKLKSANFVEDQIREIVNLTLTKMVSFPLFA